MTAQENKDQEQIQEAETDQTTTIEEAVELESVGDDIEGENAVDEAASDSDDISGDIAAELDAAQLEIVKLKDAFLRAKAEEDNVRRRSEKEIANSRKFAVEGFAKEMLNVRDSLKLAAAIELTDGADEAVKGIHEGVEVTLKQLDSAFSRFALTEIAPQEGDKLDPNLHQAMSIVDSQEVDSGCIVTVIQAGFQLHDRLLRPAMVVVAK